MAFGQIVVAAAVARYTSGSNFSPPRTTASLHMTKRILPAARGLLPASCLMLICAASSQAPKALAASPVVYAAKDCELTISEISPHCVRVELAPLDEQKRPRPAARGPALVYFQSQEKLRTRELEGVRTLRVGDLQVSLKAQPLTVTATREDGRPVQEVSFAEDNGTISFNTSAPIFGLGEGGDQFDRRGANYRVINGQRD